MPLLLGHRGARATRGVPENTIASFDLALAHGCDGFEFDVRLTHDGGAVICHDPRFDRHTISRVHRSVLTKLATLEEVLARYANRAFLNIELKVAGLEDSLLNAVREHPPRKGFLVSSFLPDVLTKLRKMDSELPLGLICESRNQLARWSDLPVQFVIAERKLITPALVEKVHAAGYKLLAWTVNDRRLMLRLVAYGLDGIISDDTELLVCTLRSAPLPHSVT